MEDLRKYIDLSRAKTLSGTRLTIYTIDAPGPYPIQGIIGDEQWPAAWGPDGVHPLIPSASIAVSKPESLIVYPKDGTNYWYIDCSEVMFSTWGGHTIEKQRADLGNVYLIKEEAQAVYQARKDRVTIREILKNLFPGKKFDRFMLYDRNSSDESSYQFSSHKDFPTPFPCPNFESGIKAGLTHAIFKAMSKERVAAAFSV